MFDPQNVAWLLRSSFVDYLQVWQEEHPRKVDSGKGWVFSAFETCFGSGVVHADPLPHPNSSVVAILRLRTSEIANDIEMNDVEMQYNVPLKLLKIRKKNFTLYNVRFSIDSEDRRFNEENTLPLRVGYFGITKRHPLDRFHEHRREALSNSGHLLHKTWRMLKDIGVKYYVVFQVCGTADTLKEIYALEEEVVKRSLTPKGLNVIPGGEAGIRFLHNLRLVKSTKIGIEERDGALIDLEKQSNKKATHYRTGHFRHYTDGKVIWVSPCWVNLDRSDD